ncbi:galactose-1-epimerase [Photobacterium sp. OFAV2-7]|uniref:galactose-1-epimerase n=1 Tax=Photobacterium sp. OFAV2-7 TaxID=2917748 RepID=UPI001EF3DE76|nr:galactose-1-epimerase [Photobacterium sp. OFAV2-7]MCG7588540.1 galactose-1-epimerase [Photobacterium sp. OFAV2-7]
MAVENNLKESMTAEAAYDGRPAQVFSLTNAKGMTVTFMDIGATWLSCQVLVEGQSREVLLGVSSMPQHQQQMAYLGATVGRYANRIRAGQFSYQEQDYQLKTNQAGNCLHGGPNGFDQRRWQVELAEPQVLIFSLQSADGDQGFPGNLTTRVRYELTDDNEVTIHYSATVDKPCPVNLTNHAYFNLMGAEAGHDCLAHQLEINAAYYLPTDNRGIPQEGLKPVVNTGFDFTVSKLIGQDYMADEDQKRASGYDHSFLLNDECQGGETVAARATSPDGKLMLEIETTKPAIQLYIGNFLIGCPNRSGSQYANLAGFALETQFLPDSPNHPEWPQPSCILKPEQSYQHSTVYRFSEV